MQLPFTVEQFFGVFRDYNLSVAPAQFFLLALGVAALILVFVPRRWSGAVISAILAFLWAWIGLVPCNPFFLSHQSLPACSWQDRSVKA